MALALLLFALGLAATVVRAQFVAGTDSLGENPSVLCNKTFADANGTGIFSFNPGVPQGPQAGQPDNGGNFAQEAQWGITLWDNIGASNATAELSAWYNTNGANYSDNANLWYDVCVVTINTLTYNSNWRGVNDQGDCLETLDSACVEALKTQAAELAFGLVSNPTPNPGSNLTQGSLGHVCYDVGNMMEQDFPGECNPYFNGSATLYGSPMTYYNYSWLYDGCDLTDQETNATFHYATGSSLFTSTVSDEVQRIVYSNFTQVVIPVLTVFMPIADIEADTTIATANAALTCPHINHINPGSFEPYAAPTPTPVGGSSLSGGAIAGIVIGALVGVAIVLGALWFFWFRKRRAGKNAEKAGDAEHPPPAYSADAKVAAGPHEQTPLTELSSQEAEVRPELPTHKSDPRVELAGDAAQYKGVGGPPAELPAASK